MTKTPRALKGPSALYDTLKNTCGGYYTVYPALQQWAGGDLNGRSRAIVWSAIFDMARSLQEKGKMPPDADVHFFKFNDSYWLPRLQMHRKTMRESIAWLEEVGAIQIEKRSLDGGHAIRHVSLNTKFIEDLIAQTGNKGRHISLIEYPRIKETPKRTIRKKADTGQDGAVSVVTDMGKEDQEVNDHAWPIEAVSVVTGRGKEDRTKGPSLPPQNATLAHPKDQAWSRKKQLEETVEDIVEDVREGFCGNSDGEEGSRNTATRRASTSALLRNFEHNSFGSGDTKQEHPGKKEATKLPGIDPEERKVSAPQLTPRQAWELAKQKMKELAPSPDTRDPWYSIGYDKGAVGDAVQAGFVYAVRPAVFKTLVNHNPRSPIGRHVFTDTNGNPDHKKLHAIVQTWHRIAGSHEGNPDVWAPIAKELHSKSPRYDSPEIQMALETFPEPDDPTWKRNYSYVLGLIETPTTSDYL